MSSYRVEHDSMGQIQVPADVYWGAQTQRSYENFKNGTEKMPTEIIRAFAILKKAAALANFKIGKLDQSVVIISVRSVMRFWQENRMNNFLLSYGKPEAVPNPT